MAIDEVMTTASDLAVVMTGVTKRFPGGVIANEDVNLELRKGEVHALLGENGAGKSTLSNVLIGLYRPDEGHISIDGVPVDISSPRHAIDLGIGMVHQHFRLVRPFTVAENVALGMPGRYNQREAEEWVRELGERHGMPVDPGARIWQLSVGEQQRVEILKALSREAKVLILDEPTAVLTPQESEVLFDNIRAMTAEGRTVVFISHKLDEVAAVADRCTVLRDGRSEGTVDVAGATTRDLARLMVGRDVVFHADDTSDRAEIDHDRVVLSVKDAHCLNDRGQKALHGVSLDVHAGEIVAVCGVAGNGQRMLAEVITGMRHRTQGEVIVDGKPIKGRDSRDSIANGVAYIPQDRLGKGLAPSISIEENLVLKSYRQSPVSRGPFLNRSTIRTGANNAIENFGIKCPGPTTPTRLLSGGNVQKVLIAREFANDPVVLIAASPTRGLDVGAIETVRAHLLQAARDGVGVLLITEELDEALALADRIAVMFDGNIVGLVDRDEANVTEIGLMMGGHQQEEVAS